MQNCDRDRRFFNIIKSPKFNHIRPADIRSLVRALLKDHKGVEFLKDTPEFQERYVETVVVRVFYSVSRSRRTVITYNDLKASNFIDTLLKLDDLPDLNKVPDHFDYVSYYTIYCKFWELDDNHDLYISKSELAKYANYSIIPRMIDRIWEECHFDVPKDCSRFSYQDFVWFILSEEDKNSDKAIELWFRCIDFEQKGYLSPSDFYYFYVEQAKKMETEFMDVVSFEDILIQIMDMLKPQNEHAITLKELKQSGLASPVFNMIFNISKFIADENQYPLAIASSEQPNITDWYKFSYQQYDLALLTDGDRGDLSLDNEEEEE